MNKTYLIAFLDLLLGMLMMVLLMVNPKAEESKEIINPPGNIIVTATWPEGESDVDLWIKGPTDEVPVGYSNKNSTLFDLLRDDLGEESDGSLGINYENAYAKGMPDGEYIVNIHAFGVKVFPLGVSVEIAVRPTYNRPTQVVALEKVRITYPGQEITIIRFKVKDGHVDLGSIHKTPIQLRTGRK